MFFAFSTEFFYIFYCLSTFSLISFWFLCISCLCLYFVVDNCCHFNVCQTAFGCPPLAVAHNARLIRQGDHAVVKCNDTDESWYLTCRGREWIGAAGNCSSLLLMAGRWRHFIKYLLTKTGTVIWVQTNTSLQDESMRLSLHFLLPSPLFFSPLLHPSPQTSICHRQTVHHLVCAAFHRASVTTLSN